MNVWWWISLCFVGAIAGANAVFWLMLLHRCRRLETQLNDGVSAQKIFNTKIDAQLKESADKVTKITKRVDEEVISAVNYLIELYKLDKRKGLSERKKKH